MDRISNVVRYVERSRREFDVDDISRNTKTGLKMVVTAAADVEHNTFGNFNHTTGTALTSTLTEDATRQYSAYNLGLKIWDGATCLIEHCRLPESGVNKWIVTQTDSATRLRCTAPIGGIAAGGSATCTSPTDADGYFGFTTLTVWLWTGSVAIQASEDLLAELYWDSSASESRWRAYAADCT